MTHIERTCSGIRATLAFLYGLTIIASLLLSLTSVSEKICTDRRAVIIGSLSVFLAQSLVAVACTPDYSFTIFLFICVIIGFGVNLYGFLSFLYTINIDCYKEGPIPVECENITNTYSAYTWAAVWSGVLFVLFALAFVATCRLVANMDRIYGGQSTKKNLAL